MFKADVICRTVLHITILGYMQNGPVNSEKHLNALYVGSVLNITILSYKQNSTAYKQCICLIILFLGLLWVRLIFLQVSVGKYLGLLSCEY